MSEKGEPTQAASRRATREKGVEKRKEIKGACGFVGNEPVVATEQYQPEVRKQEGKEISEEMHQIVLQVAQPSSGNESAAK